MKKGPQGKREDISLTNNFHFHPLHRHFDVSQVITAENSPLHIASQPDSNWAKLCALTFMPENKFTLHLFPEWSIAQTCYFGYFRHACLATATWNNTINLWKTFMFTSKYQNQLHIYVLSWDITGYFWYACSNPLKNVYTYILTYRKLWLLSTCKKST